MTFATHAVTGGALHFAIGRLALSFFPQPHTGQHTVDVVMVATGLLAGAAPDALDWLLATLGRTQRWDVYNRMHAGGDLAKFWGRIIPGWCLHVWVLDPLVHSPRLERSDPDYWVKYLSLELASLILALALVQLGLVVAR